MSASFLYRCCFYILNCVMLLMASTHFLNGFMQWLTSREPHNTKLSDKGLYTVQRRWTKGFSIV